MEWVLVCLIIVGCLVITRIFFNHKITTFEVFAQFFVPLIIVFLSFLSLGASLTKDYEIWNNYILEVVYEEPWNEYIHETCTQRVICGTNSNNQPKYCTETYDCSYVRYHPERWDAYLNDSTNLRISEKHYKELTKLFDNEQKIEHNPGYTISGDVYNSTFDYVHEHLQPYSSKHKYRNKIPVANSVMGFEKISEEDAEKFGLYKWDFSKNIGFNSNHTFGYKKSKELERVNAYYGMNYKINVIVLVYHDKPISIFQQQKAYWSGGNKNELVLGIGVSDGIVTWVDNFSWSESHEFLVELRREQEKQIKKKIDIDAIAKWLYDEIPNGWKRREFKEFDYLKIETPLKYKVAIVMICLLSSLIVSVVCIYNDVDASYQESKLPEFIRRL
jgi:hypothetical protein